MQLEDYYNKFNENKRLDSRHGQIEFRISMKYIHEYLEAMNKERSEIKILDVGAGTGRYSIPLAEEGYDVTAVELTRCNLGVMKANSSLVKAMQGNALRLKKQKDDEFDLTIVFGPLYHLISHEDKLKALLEAKRVTKPGGIIMCAYTMNEYSVITYGFKEQHVLESLAEGRLDEDYNVCPQGEDLYDYVRIEEIDRLNAEAGLSRIKILSPDGPANYIRPFVNKLSEEEFECLVAYQMRVCERMDLIGAGAHTVDILRKEL